LHALDAHAAVDRLAHVVDGEQRHIGRAQRFHFDAGLPGATRGGDDLDAHATLLIRLVDELHDTATVSEELWNSLEADYKPLAELCERTIGVPTLAGNRVDLLDDWQQTFARLLSDIEAATSTIHLEFYIWSGGGEADRVAEALIHAQRRGVTCRVLVDALGSHRFLRGKMCKRLREGGVHVVAALPGGLLRLPFVRFDLRLHRKIALIDGRIGYTGSLNLVDPRYFKKDAGVGQWVDAMVRIEGPAVEALQIVFLADWYVESHADLGRLDEPGIRLRTRRWLGTSRLELCLRWSRNEWETAGHRSRRFSAADEKRT